MAGDKGLEEANVYADRGGPDAELSDGELVALAQSGAADAFGELVRRHRAKAFGVARSVLRSREKAEDIVQEALVRAFVHVGQLTDVNRFAPWLHRIVRNQALMSIRSGRGQEKESVFSQLEKGRAEKPEWADLDAILYRMSRSIGQGGAEPSDPARHLLRKEIVDTLHGVLHCLSPRERAVFDALVFQELSPMEIAELHQLTTDNVYKTISRSRQKLKEERLRFSLREHIRETGTAGQEARVVLPLRNRTGERAGWNHCGSSAAVCFHLALQQSARSGFSFTDVMGLTGQAFRLTVEAHSIDASGPHMYYWETVFAQGLRHLGVTCRHIGDGGLAPSAYMLSQAVNHARRSLQEGKPVVAWDLFSPEFGILYGYDDHELAFHAMDAKSNRMLPYDRLGRGAANGLFVVSLEEDAAPPDELEALTQALQMIVQHACGEQVFTGYAAGLTAYDAWVQSFRHGTIDVLGNAYTAKLVSDARRFAVLFLHGLAGRWDGERRRLAMLAEEYYYDAAHALGRLSELFPFPHGGEPRSGDPSRQAIALLEEAKVSESAGLAALEQLVRCF